MDQYYSSLGLGRARMSETDTGVSEEMRSKALASIAEVREIVSTKQKEYKKLSKKVRTVDRE